MPGSRLTTYFVAKPWGRHRLWPGFTDVPEKTEPVGEICFRSDGPPSALLVKYLFTRERLSIQVHPDDARARAAGYPHGKDEAWVILAAEPGAEVALGLREATTRQHLHAAALDGSIEHLVNWKRVEAGQVIYSPAGTIHAIGAGLTLIEVQQNLDLTYRLFDYGRPRELQLDVGIAVSDPVPCVSGPPPYNLGDGRTMLVAGPKFVLERWSAGTRNVTSLVADAMFVPVLGGGSIDGKRFTGGECWSVNGTTVIVLDNGAEALFAYPGSTQIDS